MDKQIKYASVRALMTLSIIGLLISFNALANSDDDIAFIVSAKKPPVGVVFEIVESSESAFTSALAMVDKYSKQLKQKKPSMKLAIVSHGVEQFALLKENSKRFQKSHKKVQSLIDNDVPVHVCGTHASWYGMAAKDFPDFVDVAVAGPAKIRDYQRLGYALIKIDIP